MGVGWSKAAACQVCGGQGRSACFNSFFFCCSKFAVVYAKPVRAQSHATRACPSAATPTGLHLASVGRLAAPAPAVVRQASMALLQPRAALMGSGRSLQAARKVRNRAACKCLSRQQQILTPLLNRCCAAVTCTAVPTGGNAVWGSGCSGRPAGTTCAATCAAGATGAPTATCRADGRWTVAGNCSQGEKIAGGLTHSRQQPLTQRCRTCLLMQ